jgi:hypothetical protein
MALVTTETGTGNMWMDLVRPTHTANKANDFSSIINFYLAE